MKTNKRPKIVGYATTTCMATMCLANAGGDVDKACALAREHIPISDDMLDLLCLAIRQTAEVSGIVALAQIIVEEAGRDDK